MQTTNVLVAIKNIIENQAALVLSESTQASNNRINSVGESLEAYVKDAFCNSFNTPKANRDVLYSQYFSYLGNKNNPPDAMLKGGDAIEIKKQENSSTDIALNSSYPKDKLRTKSAMLTAACRACEDWIEKDMLYVIGTIPKGKPLQSVWFVYGDCYAANNEVYESTLAKVSNAIHKIEDLDFEETNELARVAKVDLLEITYLRVRGMWHIQHPSRVFRDIAPAVKVKEAFSLYTLLLESKYTSFPQADRSALEGLRVDGFAINKVKIKSPNNPASFLDARLITFRKPL